MPTHWTYDSYVADDDLQQGDILLPTDALKHTFRDVHPHFCDDKYNAFIIATQSCDLVRRKKGPKATYINLAVVRPLQQVLVKLIGQAIEPFTEGVFLKSKKEQARELFKRLLNQNEQSLGLFFLHDDADSGIAEPSIAFLRITVALRSEHYSTLLDARAGRLNAEFRAKLGWLFGNLYSRPATRDWGDTSDGASRQKDLLRSIVDAEAGPLWLEDSIARAAQKKGLDPATLSAADLDDLRPVPPIELALQQVREELEKLVPDIGDDVLLKVCNRLRNSGRFRKQLKPKE